MDLERKAIERVKLASEMSLRLYGRPLVVTDSGGKDSAVCREIVRRAGIPFEIHHNLTTAYGTPDHLLCERYFPEVGTGGDHLLCKLSDLQRAESHHVVADPYEKISTDKAAEILLPNL